MFITKKAFAVVISAVAVAGAFAAYVLGIMTVVEGKDLMPAIAALTALAAVFVGPLANFHITKQQVSAPIKQEWLNTLLEKIYTYSLSVAEYERSRLADDPDHKKLSESLRLRYYIPMMLNKKVDSHARLLDKINDYVVGVTKLTGDFIGQEAQDIADSDYGQRIMILRYQLSDDVARFVHSEFLSRHY